MFPTYMLGLKLSGDCVEKLDILLIGWHVGWSGTSSGGDVKLGQLVQEAIAGRTSSTPDSLAPYLLSRE
jgi:hypothetical protein